MGNFCLKEISKVHGFFFLTSISTLALFDILHMSILTLMAVSYETLDYKGRYYRWNENFHFLAFAAEGWFDWEKCQNSQTRCELDSFCIMSLSLFSNHWGHLCFLFLFVCLFLAMPRGMRDLSSQTRGPGIEPMAPAVEVRSLNHWTTGEILRSSLSRSAPLTLSGILSRGNVQISAVFPNSRGTFLTRNWHPGL